MKVFRLSISHVLLRHLYSWYFGSKKTSGDEFSKNLGQRLWPYYSHPRILPFPSNDAWLAAPLYAPALQRAQLMQGSMQSALTVSFESFVLESWKKE